MYRRGGNWWPKDGILKYLNFLVFMCFFNVVLWLYYPILKGILGELIIMPSTIYPTWLYWSILLSYSGQPKEIRRFIFFQSFLAHNLIQHRFMIVLHYSKWKFGGTQYFLLYSLPNWVVSVSTNFLQCTTLL